MKYILLSFVIFLTSLASAKDLKVVKVGLASNFSEVSTGSSNPYGGYFKDGVTLALRHSEKILKAKKLRIEVQDFDYGTSDIKVLEATKKAIASEVVAVLGYNYSSNALLAAPLHQESKLPMLTPSATANRLSLFGRYIHMGSFNNEFMGETLAQVAKNKLKATSAILLPAVNCAYCSDLAESFSDQFKKIGGKIASNLPILADDINFSEIVEKLKTLKFDVILIPNQELTSARLIAALSKAGIKVPYLGADGWGNVGQEFFGILGDSDFSGYSTSHWHPELKNKKSIKFVNEYKKLFGKIPNDTSVLAYDSMLLLIEAIIKSKNPTRESIENSLSSIKAFSGVTGAFVMSPNKAPKKSLVLLKAKNKQFFVLESISPSSKGSL